MCRFLGTQLVRFGIKGSYLYLTEIREIHCSVAEFGDPARRVPKTCQVKRNALERDRHEGHEDRDGRCCVAGADRGSPSDQWAMCSLEGETCRVPSPTVVRFSRAGNHRCRNANNEVNCSTREFGDPPGMVKLCEANTLPLNRAAALRPDPDEIPPPDDALWTSCAREGHVCEFRGGEQVRYGANGVYRVIYATNRLRCGASAFGEDPARGTLKRCDV